MRKFCVMLFLSMFLIVSTLNINIAKGNESETKIKTAVFRPLYSGYARGTIHIFPVGTNSTVIDREWNLEGWNLTQEFDYDTGTWASSLAMHIIYVVGDWEYWPYSGGVFYPPPVRVYISTDGGLTYPFQRDFGRKILVMENRWSPYNESTHWLYAQGVYYFPFEDVPLFGPKTRVKVQFTQTFPLEPPIYLGVYYWADGQKPVPPYDYRDADKNYVQYAIWWSASYTENKIPYIGNVTEFNFPETKTRLSKAANMIINTTFLSGASNEVVGKKFGTDSWIIIYSSQLAMMSLIDLQKVFPEENYLLPVKRFIVWMWAKQNLTDGSFPFILTDGDLHPWYDENASLWYGYDKIDSFSACAISLMRKYYDATGDLNFINQNWNHIFKAKEFIVSLMNLTYGLPVDGYHYNGTHYIKSEMNWLHDCCEAYQGIKDYAYLEEKRGNSSEASDWNTYGDSIANAIRTYFWNETLKRYAGIFYVTNGTQNTARVYNIITPVIYGIENNATRASSTVSEYVNWGILTGRYLERKWAEDYSIFNEYSTMSGMLFVSFERLLNLTYLDLWMKMKFVEVSKFLFNNPVYPDRDLQNDAGFLDFVNLVDYTWASEYARLIESSAWMINGLLRLPNMTSLFNYTEAELHQINQSLTIEEVYWENQKALFKSETGYTWNSTESEYNEWIEWLKSKQIYVQWYDFEFSKYLLTEGYFGVGEEPWWEVWEPGEWQERLIQYEFATFWLPLMFIIGMVGLVCTFATPLYAINKFKHHEYRDGFITGVVLFSIGFAFTIAWLWGA